MDDIFAMEVLHSVHDLASDDLGLVLGKAAALDDQV